MAEPGESPVKRIGSPVPPEIVFPQIGNSVLKKELGAVENCPADIFHRHVSVFMASQVVSMNLHFCFSGGATQGTFLE